MDIMTITRVSDSAIILASPETIWKTMRDFNNIALWHTDVRSSQIEDGGSGDQVGAVRFLHLQNGAPVRELLTALSDKDRTYSYSIIESPFPLLYHSSTVSLMPVEGGSKTLMTWYVEFTVKEGDASLLAAAIHKGVILAGFQGLAKFIAKTSQ